MHSRCRGQWQLDPSLNRPAKPAEELRAIVVKTAARHPVWLVGMDIAIRAKDRPGRWGVDSVPPQGGHIAYADAAKHATNIALAYIRICSISPRTKWRFTKSRLP